ncbi:MAG: fumarylacetoacetate hydrolase family protein [Clostridia bacterium]
MKYVRFNKDNEISYGLLERDKVIKLEGDLFGEYKKTHIQYELGEIVLLAPSIPSKIVAVGLNYRDHAKEMGEAIPEVAKLFIKPATCVINPYEKIILPPTSERVDYEAEIAAVIKKTAKNVTVEEANQYILGYTCFNDVTARDLQKKDVQWTRAKSFDTFGPVGPWITDEIDPNNVDIKLVLNGQEKQHSHTSNFIWTVEELISFISQIMTLLPGDIVTTGTPSGIGPMKSGDCVEVVIEGLGILKNYVE